jgi:hypothetical protein
MRQKIKGRMAAAGPLPGRGTSGARGDQAVQPPRKAPPQSKARPADPHFDPAPPGDGPVLLSPLTTGLVSRHSQVRAKAGDWLGEAAGPGSVARVESRVPPQLAPIALALEAHWDFLYQRAEPGVAADAPGVAFTHRRTQAAAKAIDRALERLDERGHLPGTGSALVFGGGYEVDLGPLLERFAEVEVVDLAAAPLELVRRKYADHPHRDRIRLVQADLSGIPPAHQAQELARIRAERAQGRAPDPQGMGTFFSELPPLEPLPFEAGKYALVVSPLLTEGLPYGPAVEAFESARALAARSGGELSPRRALDDALGESFFYRPEVMGAFSRVLQHHRDELERLVDPRGVAVFSSWMREDEHQPERGLLRVGDTRATPQTWGAVFEGWGRTEQVVKEQIYGPDKRPTLNAFVLEKAG